MMKSVTSAEIHGRITAPGSKSAAQRALACALVARGRSVIAHATLCDDVAASLRAVKALGSGVSEESGVFTIMGGIQDRPALIDCGEAGLAIRMFSPIAALISSEVTLAAHGSLRRRPLGMIRDGLSPLGISVTLAGEQIADGAPVLIRGPLAPSDAIMLDGSLSSQFLTGVLIALASLDAQSVVTVRNLKSRPYIDMTIEMITRFGGVVRNENYERFTVQGGGLIARDISVEGDWSGAAFPAVAAAVAGRAAIANLDAHSAQADIAVLDALAAAGAALSFERDVLTVERGSLNAFTFDATECPDLFPPLAALAARCRGVSAITGISRLAHKESPRDIAIRDEFAKAGIAVTLEGDTMHIAGGEPISCVMDSRGDHRMAMAAAVLFAGTGRQVRIAGAECVSKSYPGFYDDMMALGAEVTHE